MTYVTDYFVASTLEAQLDHKYDFAVILLLAKYIWK